MSVRIIEGDCMEVLRTLPDESVHCVVTSPPYWGLRDYGVAGQLGLEPTLAEHIETMVAVFEEVRRVLRSDGTVWLNYGDSYAGSTNTGGTESKQGSKKRVGAMNAHKRLISGNLKPKDLCMVPNRLAIALQDRGWWVRSEIIWSKMNPMPESVTDRPACAHEKIFLLSKSARYFYDAQAVRQPSTSTSSRDQWPAGWASGPGSHSAIDHNNGNRTDKQRGHGRRHAGFNDRWDQMTKDEQQSNGANLKNVWNIATKPFSKAHFATFPPALAERCIKAGTSEHGVCSTCAAPWRRKTESTFIPQEDVSANRGVRGAENQKPHDPSNSWGGSPRGSNSVSTSGWVPTCGCDVLLPLDSAVILDPFGGAGTTGLVADQLRRDAILIELNPEYIEIARQRITSDAPLLTDCPEPPSKAEQVGMDV